MEQENQLIEPRIEDFTEVMNRKAWEKDLRYNIDESAHYRSMANNYGRQVKTMLKDGSENYAYRKARKEYDEAIQKTQMTIDFDLLEKDGSSPTQLDLSDSLREKVAANFSTIGEIREWLNRECPEKKKGIGESAKEKIANAINKFFGVDIETLKEQHLDNNEMDEMESEMDDDFEDDNYDPTNERSDDEY